MNIKHFLVAATEENVFVSGAMGLIGWLYITLMYLFFGFSIPHAVLFGILGFLLEAWLYHRLRYVSKRLNKVAREMAYGQPRA